MNFPNAVRAGLTKLLTVKGRASRSEFWYYQLFIFLLSVAIIVAAALIHALLPMPEKVLAAAFWLIYGTFSLSGYASIARRLHDRNRSAWHILWFFIPAIGPLVILIWCWQKGVGGDNRYGPDPLRGAAVAG
jgi:uncharacterized membrane protein YhaH (DUF805 family)